MKHRTVVLGAGGFMGSHVVERLRQDGAWVEPVSRQQVDLTDPAAVMRLGVTWGPGDAVVFCAGIPRDRDASWHAADFNLRMARNLAGAIRAGGCRGVLFLSSSAVYAPPGDGSGEGVMQMNEETPLEPKDPYSFSKIESEHILEEHCRQARAPFLALRPSIVFGRHDRGRSLIGRWAQVIHQGEPVAVRGKGTARLDLITADDVADAVLAWTLNPFSGVMNAASGQPLEVRRILMTIGEALGKPALIDDKMRSHETEQDQIFDVSHIQKLVSGWPRRPVRASIQSYVHQMMADSVR